MVSKTILYIVIAVIVIIIIGVGVYLLTATSPKKVELTIEYGEPWKDLVKPVLSKYVEEMRAKGIEVTVKEKMIPYGQDAVKVITSDFAAGVAGDIIIVDSFMIPSYASAGYLYALDNLIAKWDDWNQYPEPMRRIVEWKGKVYGIMIDTDVRMIWYRKDIFKMAGLPENWQPKTWEDILKVAEVLKANTAKIKSSLGVDEFYPLYIPAGTKWGEATTMQGFYMLLLGADKPPYNRLYDYEKDKWVCKSTALWRAFKFYIDVYQKYKVGPIEYNFAPDVWATHRKVFSEGKIAMEIGGSWEWGEGWGPEGIAPLKACQEQCGADKQCYINCEAKYIGYAKMPGYSGGAQGEPPFITISGGWAIALNANLAKDETKLEVAWELVKFIASRDNIARFCAKYGKIAPRMDALQVPEYAGNAYLKAITEYLRFTDFRDALPDYPKVSSIIQEVTEKIIRGEITDPDQALEQYCSKLKETVGADNVVEYQVIKG